MRHRGWNKKLGAVLLGRGLIDPARLESALAECERRSLGLAVVLVEGGALSESALLAAVGSAARIPTLEFDPARIDPRMAAVVPLEFSRQRQLLALGLEGEVLRVAVADPFDVTALDELMLLTRRRVQPVFVYEGALTQALAALESFKSGDLITAILEGDPEESPLAEAEPEPMAEPEPEPPMPLAYSAPPPSRSRPTPPARLDDTTVFAPPAASSVPQPEPEPQPVAAARAGAASPPEGARAVVDVFYATDRHRRLLRRKPESRFSGARNRTGELHLGRCQVSIPLRHRTGRLERPSWFRLEFRESVARHVVIVNLSECTTPEFYGNLRLQIARSPGRAALVFVHGYNVSFGDALRRTAQLAYDLEFEGAPITYSWPSRGKLSGYLTDENNVAWSVPHLETFLLSLREHTGAETVHLIAHSMGSRALSEALARIAARPHSPGRADFRQVVLAAPDIDADVFRDLAPRFAANAQRVTLYASSRDEALEVSGKLHGGYARAGQTEPEVVVVRGVDTIDASAVGTGLGHSYYGDEPTIVSDLFYLLRADAPPGERHRMEPRRNRDLVYWALRG